ncbi:MAG TPA: glucose 1-dehydrogenase [Acidimicrobiales bacterium]|nr:glucose 1-dehydrogenase [Acidimicrobiales bacterium]
MNGKVAVVTGGGSGIGRATAIRLAKLGAEVIVADVNVEGGEGVADEIGGRFVRTDVTEPAQVDALMQACGGRLDIAFNNAGTSGTFGNVADTDVEEWRRVVDLNLLGVYLCMRAEIPLMTAGGVIVNTSSGAGLMGFAGLSAYVASKHAVIGLTKTAALEYARAGIRINAVCPGTVRTPMLEGFTGGDEATLQAMGKMMPLGRLATPDEIAAAVVWLCSDEASYVTGMAMPVDGGAAAASART